MAHFKSRCKTPFEPGDSSGLDDGISFLFLFSSNIKALCNFPPGGGCDLSAIIKGTSPVNVGDTKTHTLQVSSGSLCTQYIWDVTGGTRTSSSKTSVTIKWTSPGTRYVEYYVGTNINPTATKTVTVINPSLFIWT